MTLLLVTTYFDNSGFSRVVTLKSLGGGFLLYRFSPFVNKSSSQIYFLLHI